MCSISAVHRARRGLQSRVLRPATYINNDARCKSEDTLLLPSESEALSDAMVARRPEGVSGSVAMVIRWDRCHGGAVWNIHPLASFPRFPLLPPALPRPYHPLVPRLFAPSLSLLAFLPPPLSPPLFVRVFLPRYTYVFSRPPTLATLSSSLPRHSLAGPFASFVPRLTPFQRWQRWLTRLSLFLLPRSLLLRRLIAHRPSPRFYFVTASLIPRYTSLLSVSLLSLALLWYCFAITINSA